MGFCCRWLVFSGRLVVWCEVLLLEKGEKKEAFKVAERAIVYGMVSICGWLD